MGGIDDKNAGGLGIFTNLKRDGEGWRLEKDGGRGMGGGWRLEEYVYLKNRSESEFNEFRPRLKSPKNLFQLSASLNLEKIEYNFK